MGKQPQSSPHQANKQSTISSRQASIGLYLVVTVVLGLIVGSILQGLGMLPRPVTAVAGSLAGVMVFLSGLFGSIIWLIFRKTLPKEIWKNANRRAAFLLSALTVVLGVLLVTVPLWAPRQLPAPKVSASPTVIPGGATNQGGTQIVSDPLIDNSQNLGWDENKNCQFSSDGYHVATSVNNYTFYCTANATNLNNFIYEVQMIITRGYGGGAVIRANADNSTFYYFRVDNNGNYTIIIFTGHTSGEVLDTGVASNFHKGFNHANLLTITAVGDRFDFYVNHTKVTFVNDGTYKNGQIGVAISTSDNSGESIFTNLKLKSCNPLYPCSLS